MKKHEILSVTSRDIRIQLVEDSFEYTKVVLTRITKERFVLYATIIIRKILSTLSKHDNKQYYITC